MAVKQVGAADGPYSENVIVPPAAACAVELIEPSPSPPVPGWLAVPVSVAVSSIGFPSTTDGVALVLIVGVTGLTVKHSVTVVVSPEFGSLEGGTL